MEQERVRKSSRRAEPQATTEETPAKAKAKTGEELVAEMDDLLDEIDGVLEENAETFVNEYVQKGGE